MLEIIILLLLLLFVSLIFFVTASSFFGFVRTRVPFVPTKAADVRYICAQNLVSPADVFYDLGSGDGKVVFLVEELTGAKTTGFELTRWTHLLAKIKGYFRKSKSEFYRKDFFKVPWRDATVIYGYLYPALMARVEEKFTAECKPGSRAIIRDFPLPTLAPTLKFLMPGKHEIYIYEL